MAGETAAGDVSERMLFAPTLDAGPLVPVQSPVALSPANRRFPLPAPLAGALPKALLPASTASIQFMSRALRRELALEIDRGAAFLLVPVFLAFGAIVYFALPFEPGFAPALGGALAIGLVLALLPSRGVIHFALAAVLVCLLGLLAAKVETWRAGTKMLGGEISTLVTGRVAAIDHLANGRTRLTLDVTATARPKLRYAPDRIRASAIKVPAGLAVGAEVAGLVRLMPPSGPVRPQSYDFSFESYFDGIGASGFFLRPPQLTTAAAPQSINTEETIQNNGLSAGLHLAQPDLPLSARGSAWIQNGRNAIADRIRERIGGPEGEIAAALVVGVRAGIPETVNESLRRTGLYHVISISGLHMALVAGTIMGGLRVGFALFPGFSSRRPVKKYAAIAALASISAYLFISGGEVAAQRSFIMLAVMLTALLFDRAALTMRNLAISAIAVIAISPHEVIGPSFQMSFAATAALVGAYAWWSDRKQADSTTARPPNRSPAGGRRHAEEIAGVCRRPCGDLCRGGPRDRSVRRIPFPTRLAAQPGCEPCGDADSFNAGHAFRCDGRRRHAARHRGAVLLRHGQGPVGHDRGCRLVLRPLPARCGRARTGSGRPAQRHCSGLRHHGDDQAPASGLAVRGTRRGGARIREYARRVCFGGRTSGCATQ
jgi:competence protein ComEC